MASNALDTSTDGVKRAPASSRKLPPGPGRAAPEVAAHQIARIHDSTIQLAAEGGYKNLKVRDVVRLAEVSTRAFYEHFDSKEDCFLQTYELISRRSTRRIIAAQAGESEWRDRASRVLAEFFRGLEENPAAARLALVEVYAADEASLERAWRAERNFQGMLAEAFARSPGGTIVPPIVIEGMVAGIASVAKSYLLNGRVPELSSASGDLIEWASSFTGEAAAELTALDRQSVWRDTTFEPLAGLRSADGGLWPSTGDRALILNAVAELAAEHGYQKLTASRIRATAGVSRRKFDAHFDDLEDCYLAAVERHAEEALARAARAQAAAVGWGGGIYRAISALCERVASDAFLARVCLANEFPPSPSGARARQRLITAVSELLLGAAPRSAQVSALGIEASTGAVWSLFHHHIARGRARRDQIAASLSYLVSAPIIGPSGAVSAIRVEQGP